MAKFEFRVNARYSDYFLVTKVDEITDDE